MAADQDTILEPGTAILVVDDSRVMRQALKKILSATYPVVEAGDGEEGWARIQEDPSVCCVYTDLSMPRLDGYGLIKRIRQSADPRVREIPVVLITGNEDGEGTRQQAISIGASSVVQKPFNSGDILETARRHVQHARARRSAAPAASAQQAAEVTTLRRRVMELEATLLDLRGQLQVWQEEARRAEASSLSASAEWEETLNAMRLQLGEVREERDRLRKDHDRLRTELIIRQQSVDEKRVSDRMRELQNQLAAERSDLSRIRDEARELGVQLQAARSAANEAASRASDLEARLQHVLAEQAEAREETTRLRGELESVRAEHGALEQALGLERGQVADLQSRLEMFQQEAAQRSLHLSDTERELAEWQGRAREAEQALGVLQEQSRSGAGSREQLERELESERERADAAEQAASVERERVRALEFEQTRLQEELSAEQTRLQEAVSAERGRIQAAEQKAASLQEAYDAMKEGVPDANVLEDLRARAEAAELKQLQMEDELVEMASRMERGDEARKVAETELRALMHELADARRQLRERTVAPPAPSPAPAQAPGRPPAPPPEADASTRVSEGQGVSAGEAADEGGTAGVAQPREVAEEAVGGAGAASPAAPVEPLQRPGPDPLIRQWEAERRRQRRLQLFVVIALAAAVSLGLYYLLA
jgi:DNA-binding response OmpR family regulator/predicted  nucleic acid-binding Zn-ribbon protein